LGDGLAVDVNSNNKNLLKKKEIKIKKLNKIKMITDIFFSKKYRPDKQTN